MIDLVAGLRVGPMTLRNYLPTKRQWVCELDGIDHVIRVNVSKLHQLLRGGTDV